MKIKFLSVFLLLTMIISLTACTINLDLGISGGKEEPKEPFFITYESMGNGTCAASVSINAGYGELIELVIPDASPEGEAVTKVSFTDNLVPIAETFPRVISEEGMDELIAQFEANLEDGKESKEFMRFRSFYVFFDYTSENTAPIIKERILEDYPFMEYTGSGYIFDPRAASREVKLIAEYICEYTDLTPQKVAKAETEKIISAMKSAGVLESDFKNKILEDQRYTEGVSTLCIKSLKLPTGLKTMEISTPDTFYLESIIVPEGSVSGVIETLSYADISYVYSLDTEAPEGFELPKEIYVNSGGEVVPEEEIENSEETELTGTIGIPKVRWYSETKPVDKAYDDYWRYVEGKPLAWSIYG